MTIFNGFVGGSYKGRSAYINPQTCVNLYPIQDDRGGKNITALVGTPGLRKLGSASIYGAVRCMAEFSGKLYAVVDNKFYYVDGGFIFNEIGTIGSGTTPVQMEFNGVEIMLVDGSAGYIYNVTTSTFSQITDPDFPTPGSLTYQDGYFIVTKKDSGQFYISGLIDGLNWDALDFASAESKPDDAVAIISDHRELWILGEKTTEVYYNSGNADFPFERISGSTQEIGCGAKYSVAKGDNTLFWLDNRGFVVRASGYSQQIVSTRNIEYQWSKYSRTDDAIGIVYNYQGHIWYQITFPSADKTWVYDVATNQWHERTSYLDTGGYGRHRMMSHAKAYGRHLAGDYLNGCLYEIDIDTFTDNGKSVVRERTCPVISSENARIFFPELQIDFEPGVGTGTTDPQAVLDWSDDGGMTWSNELWRSIGKAGEYYMRAVWHNLGSSRNRVFRVRISDPVKVVITGAYLRIEKGMH